MRRLSNRLRTLQEELLATVGSPPTAKELNDTLLIALATVLHESGIVAAPTGAERRAASPHHDPRGLREVPQK